jgi:hypothetical protein
MGVGHCIESSTMKDVKNGRKNYMTKKYLGNRMIPMKGSARSASCRCRLIQQKLRFIHAAVNSFAMAVVMPISRATEAIGVHSVESQLHVMMKNTRRE